MAEKIILFAFGILQLVIMARFIPEEELGLMALASTVLILGHQFVELGMGNSILHQQETDKNTLSSLFWWFVIMGWVVTVVVMLIAWPLAIFYDMPGLKIIILVVSTSIGINSLGQLHRTLLYKELQIQQLSTINVFSQLIQLILIVILAVKGYGVWSLVVGAISRSVIQTLAWIALGVKFHIPHWHMNFTAIKPHLSFGIYQTGERLVTFLHQQIDTLIIGKLFGAEVLGVYNILKRLVMKILRVINPIFTSVSMPLLSKVQHMPEAVKTIYLTQIRYIGLLNFPAYVLLALNMEAIFVYLLLPDWNTPTNQWVIIGFCLFCLAGSMLNPMGTLIISHGKVVKGFLYNLCVSILMPFSLLGIGWYTNNVAALSLAMGIFQLLMIPVSFFYLIQPIVAISFSNYIAAFGYIFLASSFAIMGVHYGLSGFHDSMIIQLIADFILGGLAYVFIINKLEKGLIVEAFKFIRNK
jgi:O-antigen/teichoic acid export membrane protein